MFLYSLLALAVVTALIFAAPRKARCGRRWQSSQSGALWASATAVGVLAGGHTVRLWATDVFLFGSDAGSMDPLSALFALIVSVGAVAAVLYSRGYLAHYLGRKSPAHISLHYTALATMFYAMLGVVTSEGGFSFLFFWELMTVASFLLILFDAERREVRRAALAYVIMMHVGIRPAAHRLRAVGQRLRIGRLRPVAANMSARSPPCRCSWSSSRASA